VTSLSLSLLLFRYYSFLKSQLPLDAAPERAIPKRERAKRLRLMRRNSARNGNDDIVAASFSAIYRAVIERDGSPETCRPGLVVIAKTSCAINFPRRSQERYSDLIINPLEREREREREREKGL
jgi:hypothetical protein